MACWKQGGNWSGGGAGDGSISFPTGRYSNLGVLAGGTTTPAGTALPATGGKCIPAPGATTWVRISGTAAVAGDTILVTWAGGRTSSAANPATRRLVGSGPGEPGTTVLPDGVIEIALSASNPDATSVTWILVRGG